MYGFWQMATFMWLRAAILAATGMHLAFRARAHKHKALAREVHRRVSITVGAATRDDDRNNNAPLPKNKASGGKVAFEVMRLLLSAGIVFASAASVFKLVYQPLSQLLSWNTGCIQPGSPFHTCLQSWTKSDECSNGFLNWTIGDSPLVMTYSYEQEVFWSSADFGPARVDCVAPRHHHVDGSAHGGGLH